MPRTLASSDQRISERRAMELELARLLDSWQDCGGSKSQA
jgi:hypothetical protein